MQYISAGPFWPFLSVDLHTGDVCRHVASGICHIFHRTSQHHRHEVSSSATHTQISHSYGELTDHGSARYLGGITGIRGFGLGGGIPMGDISQPAIASSSFIDSAPT